MKEKIKGFTLIQLLIVVAIIIILIAIAIPIFFSHLEKSRQTTDLANVRSAYAEILIASLSNDTSSPFFKNNGFYEIKIPLIQKQDGWSIATSKLNIAGVTPLNENWIGFPRKEGFCTITYSFDNGIIIDWSGGGDINYLNATAPYQNKDLMELKNINNDERVAADQATLSALGKAILNQNWTLSELKNKLGILVQGNTVRIADYYQQKNGNFENVYSSNGFRIDSKSDFHNILKDIGFKGGKSTTNNSSTIYEKSLFYSDELATNKFKNYPIEQTKRSIILENVKTDNSGKVTSFTIYSKAMDNQANMTEAEKAKFRIKIN